MTDSITIASRFRGPPESGNGGYSAGSLARGLSGAVEVTLRKPPPLDRALALEHGSETLRLLDGADVVAEARSAALALDVPAPPSFEEATELSQRYIGFREHSFPGCFVCGPARAPEDGLRIFPGRRADSELAAAPWVPSRSVALEGRIPVEILWAALDCPGYFGAIPDSVPKALLGRITADVSGGVEVGEPCVVIGWRLGLDGRKLHAGSALFGADGTLRGRARQTWIILNS
jgi:hypothetical protein